MILDMRYLREIFIYDESVPSCLRWKNSLRPSLNGKPVGYFDKGSKRYRITNDRIKLNHTVNKIIWQYHYGDLTDSDSILHQDDNLVNNNISNLYKISLLDCKINRDKAECSPISEVFYYKSGVLYWKMPLYVGRVGLKRRIFNVGDPVTYHVSKSTGYSIINLKRPNINNRWLYYHRAVYELVMGSIDPELYIDHINGDKQDNRIENLRLVTPDVNQRNTKMLSTNKSGVTGVSKCGNYWVASWFDENSNQIRKHFNYKKIGDNEAFTLACAARIEGIDQVNKILNGNGYTDRHGKRL